MYNDKKRNNYETKQHETVPFRTNTKNKINETKSQGQVQCRSQTLQSKTHAGQRTAKENQYNDLIAPEENSQTTITDGAQTNMVHLSEAAQVEMRQPDGLLKQEKVTACFRLFLVQVHPEMCVCMKIIILNNNAQV